MCYSALQFVANCCSVLHYVAVCLPTEYGNPNFNPIELTLILESQIMFTVVFIRKSGDELTFEKFLKIQIYRYGI